MNMNYLKLIIALTFSTSAFAETMDPFYDLSCSKSQIKTFGNETSLMLSDCNVGKYSRVSLAGRDRLRIYGVNISYNKGIQNGGANAIALLKLFQEIQQQQAIVDLSAGFHTFNSSGGMSDHWVLDRIESLNQLFFAECDDSGCKKLPYLSIGSNDPNID